MDTTNILNTKMKTTKAVPDWVNFPGNEWESITPEQAGLDPAKFNVWVKSQKVYSTFTQKGRRRPSP